VGLPAADYGYCTAKNRPYDGVKLGWRIARRGLSTPYPLLAARPYDINYREAWVADFSGVVPADKGFLDAHKQALLAQRHASTVLPPPRARMQTAPRLSSTPEDGGAR
jgi:hypothetical protein